jgi:hypothetical protein
MQQLQRRLMRENLFEKLMNFKSSNFVRASSSSGLAPHKFGIVGILYPPANTLELPAATEVHPVIPSPILPAPLPLTKTVVDPVVIGAA